MQPILAYLVTPMVGHNTQGQTVIVCTLKGQKLVKIDLPSIIDTAAAEPDAEHCSALKLFQMAGAARISPPFTPLPVHLYSVAVLDQTADTPHRTLHFSAYATRAPPRLT
ncbi:hypothetical protein [Thiosocius teredinicola]|uniref:hypothetical protein n=1 Tax=Thiosocius teredinicola TaxID=1973002 RepID=UPI000F7A2C17